MRTNGTLQYCIFSSGGFNEDGEPIPVGSKSWSDPIPCSIKTETNDSKGVYEDGKFNQASFTVLVEASGFPLDITRVRLTRSGNDLGEFAVQGVPTPTTMDRVIIVV